jgi:hypothetical protein
MVIRMEVNMMGLAVLRMWLLRMKWGYRGYNNVLVTREEVNMMGLVVLRVWLVMNRATGTWLTEWGCHLQQGISLGDGSTARQWGGGAGQWVQGCDARLRGRCHTVWVYFGMRGFVLECWDISALLCSG